MKKLIMILGLLVVLTLSMTNNTAFAIEDSLPKIMKTMSYSSPTHLQ
ncbi:hypothetical protein [Sporosarcina sp. Te-1]|nr:hypothetical protein [Sporosarcina sp. Te-1]QTD41034.1 hypothetical protein J3U78_20270 [Sporosarcina sp. Te-1]